MTAHAMAGDEDKSLDAGMDGHVTKPIDPDQLFTALLKWIQPAERRIVTPQEEMTTEARSPELPKNKKAEDDLPNSLPGFDLAAGLERLMGNKRLYRKLLLDFGSRYAGAADDIRGALDQQDFEQAHGLVHNLKGLAGNLAALDLQAATVEMEKLVKGDVENPAISEQLHQKLQELERVLDEALQAVQTLGLPAEEKSAETPSDALAAIPPDLIKDMLDRIHDATEMGDISQVGSIAEEMKSRSNDLAPFCDRFIQLAEDFDFDGIAKLADELG
jgi:HPt (histidine-containing phosphotransfer) domain-containing protein